MLMSNPENYIDAPTNNAVAVIAVAPNRPGAFKLGAFSGKTTDTSINALLLRRAIQWICQRTMR